MKNPFNPMFDVDSRKYDAMKTKFKVWIPQLETLDGSNFDLNKDQIAREKDKITQDKQKVLAKFKQNSEGLATIPENKSGFSGKSEDEVLADMKKKSGNKT